MHVIHIFGASGSGTSTLGKALAEALGLAHLDSDDYFWLPTDPPFCQKRTIPERLSMMNADIDRSGGAVLSGSLCGWGDPLIPRFTLVIRLVTDTAVRLQRIRDREYRRFGNRILAGGDMADTHRAFLDWASRYDTGDPEMRSKANHDLWQQKLPCPVLTLDGTTPLPLLVNTVMDALREQSIPASLTLRPARSGEEEQILRMYRSVIGTGFCVWDEEYPSMAFIRNDMAAGCLFVLSDGTALLGAVSVVPENELDDLALWTHHGCSREIARVVIRKELQGKGLSRTMLTMLIDRLRGMGTDCIRLLAQVDNLPALALYRRLGFTEAGPVKAYGHEYMAMELRLSGS